MQAGRERAAAAGLVVLDLLAASLAIPWAVQPQPPPPWICTFWRVQRSQAGIFWWSFFSAGKFQGAEIEALAEKPSWAPEEEEEEKGNGTAQWSGLRAVGQS